MTDETERWRQLAQNAIGQRNLRDVKREAIVSRLDPDWSAWSDAERDIYAAAFLFPAPMEPMIDNVTISGVTLKLKRLARTARIVDETGAVWLVIEHARPEKL